MTKVTNEYPYVGLKTLVWKTKKSSPKPEPRMFSNDGVFVGTSEDVHELKEELESLKDDWNMCDTACDELTFFFLRGWARPLTHSRHTWHSGFLNCSLKYDSMIH